MKIHMNRRRFLRSTAAGVGAIAASPLYARDDFPMRTLGRTRARVSILGFGGGSRFMMYQDEDKALSVVTDAIDQGLNYLDTAMEYGGGESEVRYGKALQDRRDQVFLTTKVPYRNYDEAMKGMERSLRRLQTDHVDLLHIHSLGRADDLAEIEAPQGVLKAVYKIRDEKMARFIGITSHTDADTLKTAIERHDFDCVMMALNAATRTGHATGFESKALPAALKKDMGILAMKITGQEQLLGEKSGKARMKDLLYYSFSLPVASCVVGMPRAEFVHQNMSWAREFSPLSETEKKNIRKQVQPSVEAFDRFLSNHQDEIKA